MAEAALVGAIIWPPDILSRCPVMAISLEESSALQTSLELCTKRSLNPILSLSKKLCWIDPITLANLSMSVGLFSTQSVNRSEIYSVSMDFLASRFFLVLSILFVRHFLKIN